MNKYWHVCVLFVVCVLSLLHRTTLLMSQNWNSSSPSNYGSNKSEIAEKTVQQFKTTIFFLLYAFWVLLWGWEFKPYLFDLLYYFLEKCIVYWISIILKLFAIWLLAGPDYSWNVETVIWICCRKCCMVEQVMSSNQSLMRCSWKPTNEKVWFSMHRYRLREGPIEWFKKFLLDLKFMEWDEKVSSSNEHSTIWLN